MAAILLLQITMFMVDGDGRANGAVHAADERRSRLLWASIKDGRSRLMRGAFRAHGRYVASFPDRGNVDGPVAIFAAFDLNPVSYRFDRSEPQVVPGGAVDSRIEFSTRVGGRWVLTPKMSLLWLDVPGGSTVALTEPRLPKGSPVGMFDVRAIGLMNWNSTATETTFEFALDSWTKINVRSIVAEQNYIYKFTGTHGKDNRVEAFYGLTAERSCAGADGSATNSGPLPRPDADQRRVMDTARWRLGP